MKVEKAEREKLIFLIEKFREEQERIFLLNLNYAHILIRFLISVEIIPVFFKPMNISQDSLQLLRFTIE